MYTLKTYDHDGYNNDIDTDDFEVAFKRALFLASLHPKDRRYSIRILIQFNGNPLCEVYPQGAISLIKHLEG